MQDKIVIIGAGLGGLTAALALLRQGVAVEVFESAKAIGDVGAGISLGVTANRGLFSLGLEDALAATANAPQRAGAALHYQTGEVLGGAFKDRQWRPQHEGRTYVLHRADLYAILESAVRKLAPDAIRLGHRFEGFEQDADGVVARFDNGREVRGAALIGADGVRSRVREAMFGPENPLFTGQVAYRFLVPMEQAAPFMTADPAGPYVGPGRLMTRYPVRHGTVVNCVAFVTTDRWTGEGWSQQCSVEELQEQFAGWHPDVVGLAANAPVEKTAKWALYDRDPLETWVEGRVALLGDAAHPMLPFLGLGAGMAIEDAVVLGRAFGERRGVADTLAVYQRARVPRANLILLESRRQAQTFREGPGGLKPYTLTTHEERMNYDPSTVPL